MGARGLIGTHFKSHFDFIIRFIVQGSTAVG